jgi:hypothetical protein
VRDVGNSIYVSEPQFLNTRSPIVFRDVGRDTLTKPEYPKTLGPNEVRDVDNETDVNEPQLLNTLSPNDPMLE